MTCRCLRLVASDKMSAMFCTLRHLIGWLISAFCSRQDLILDKKATKRELIVVATGSDECSQPLHFQLGWSFP